MSEKRLTGTTDNGFEFDLDERITRDIEYIDALRSGNTLEIVDKLFKFDPGQKTAVYNFVRADDGFVDVEKVVNLTVKIITAVTQLKNS